jgi:hypothetical protein
MQPTDMKTLTTLLLDCQDQSPIVRESVWKRAMRPAGIAAKWASLCGMLSVFRVEHASLVQRIEVGVVFSVALTLLIAVPVYLIAALCYAIGRSRTAEEQLKKVDEADHILSDPASRARHDASRAGSSDPPPRGTADAASPPTSAQQASRPVKLKKNILKILILCIILSGMIAVVVEYKPSPKAGVANDAEQVYSLIGAYQRVMFLPGFPNDPIWIVQTYYADGTCNENSYLAPNESRPMDTRPLHCSYRLDADTVVLGLAVDKDFYPIQEPHRVIKDSTGRVARLYDPAEDVMWNRIR